MTPISIGIVEDEMIIANVLELTLRKLGYSVAFTAFNYNTAMEQINDKQPDLLLLDINLGGQKDGIDLADHVRQNHSILIIFLTANSDTSTVARAKEIKPNAFLLKPFNKESLYAAIEIAVAGQMESTTTNKSILVKSGYDYVRVLLNDIRYVSSDQNYVTIHLSSKQKIMVRSTLAEMHTKLGDKLFFKISRGFVVNIQHVTEIKTDSVQIGQEAFQLSRNQRDTLRELIRKK